MHSSFHTRPRWLVLLVICLAASCQRGASVSDGQSGAAQPSAVADALPPLKLSDDTANLLLTWVDADGNFHVGEHISDVPQDRRERVRVVITGQEPGTGQTVYVADLRTKNADGTYPVKSVPRGEWDAVGADLRKSRLEALAPKAAPSGSSAAPEAKAGTQKPKAIIYGADWCNPCHQAEAYLRQLGVDVTKKNIEKSEAAEAEMHEKLARAGRNEGSIPVIDFMGHIFVGFDPDALKRALDRGREPSTL